MEFKGQTGETIAKEAEGVFGQTVRHYNCSIMSVGAEQCAVCAFFQTDLFVRRSRLKQVA